ncbi:MAG TPA: oligosaccharide flippase family protein [Mucilaginibacter sp.]|jgi:O-antigen/teichoic acid export membrane protein|nr:oligosaccharide flippase family protein [Mucilaginibacter sp.]
MRTKLVNLSANTLQLIINQLSGLVIFYILSVSLDKNSFGEINLALALLLASFNILSFGIDQVSVRKIASGENPQKVISVYLIHVIITGIAFYGLLLLGRGLFPSNTGTYNLLLLIGIGKLAIYFSMVFKQSAIGMERFKLLARMSVITNVARGCAFLILAFMRLVSLNTVIIVFISGDVLELLVGFYFFKLETCLPTAIGWNKDAYTRLIKESLPQLGVVVITSALARFDWIFIGIVVSAIKLAEYSFAYKVFELSTLPLLAIAPILIPWFTRMFKQGELNIERLQLLARMEIIIATFTVLLLNICWTPMIDLLTHGKYGVVNERTLFILSLCIPLQYLCNFLWTIYFAKGQLKLILKAFALTFSVNIIGDIILIPLYKNEGAAIACLAGYIVQIIFYSLKNELKPLNKVVYNLVICTACACGSFFAAKMLFSDFRVAIPAAILFFITLLLITGQVRLSDVKRIKGLI